MKIVVAYGTRPERIKIQPVQAALEARGAEVVVYETVQSPDLVSESGEGHQAGIHWSSLTGGIAQTLHSFKMFLAAEKPDAVLVQGDVATAFACALGAFLEGVPVGHVEAGLRTYAAEPWPEEAFRRAIAPFATWHFCPDVDAAENLLREMGGKGQCVEIS